MGDKKNHYDHQMTLWKCHLNEESFKPKTQLPEAKLPSPPLQPQPARMRISQSETNLPELVLKEYGASDSSTSVNLRSHSDLRYHMNVLEPHHYWDRQRAEKYKRELDDQVREKNRLQNQEKRGNAGFELATLMTKSPSLPKLPYLNSTDVTRPFNFSPRLTAFKPVSPQTYHTELSRQETIRKNMETYRRQKEREEAHQHYNSWSLFWGRPGHGAPVRVNHKKENLFNLLHYNPKFTTPTTNVNTASRSNSTKK